MSADKDEVTAPVENKADANPVFGNYVTDGTRVEVGVNGINGKQPVGYETVKHNVRNEKDDGLGAATGLTEVHFGHSTDGKNHGVSTGLTNVEIYPHGEDKDFAVFGQRGDLNVSIDDNGKKTLSGSGHLLAGDHVFVGQDNIPVSGFVGVAASSDGKVVTGTVFANEGIGSSGDSNKAVYLNLNQSITTTRDAQNLNLRVAPDIANFNAALSAQVPGTKILGTVKAGVDVPLDPDSGPPVGVAVGADVGVSF